MQCCSGLQFWPDCRWAGIDSVLAYATLGIRSQSGVHLNEVTDSMSTFIVAAAAVFVLWRFRPRSYKCQIIIHLPERIGPTREVAGLSGYLFVFWDYAF